MRLLLVGHGYLGQRISRVFTDAGWQTFAVSRSGDDGTIACDVGDPHAVAELPQADLIIHCAASGRGGPDAYRHVYLAGCEHLVRSFPSVPILFTSSTSVYAQTDGSEVTEESPAEPDRETGRVLLQAEQVILDAGGWVARLSGIYGPGRSVILTKFLTDQARIEEDGRRILNQIHRDDAASAVFHLTTTGVGGGIFNVSDSHPMSQLDCYLQLAAIFSKPLPESGPRDPDRKRGWTHKRVSNAKLISTGWRPAHPSFTAAASGIASTLE